MTGSTATLTRVTINGPQAISCWKRASLACVAALSLPLTGCTAQPGPAVTVTVTVGTTASSRSTPTPAAKTLLTVAEARTIYLKNVCPTNGGSEQMYRALKAMVDSTSDVNAAARQLVALDHQAMKALSNPDLSWPNNLDPAIASEVEDLNSNAAYTETLALALTPDQVNSATAPGRSGPNPADKIRAALGIGQNRDLTCVNYNTVSAPKGYPKVQKVGELPDQVRSSYQEEGHTTAVALAPGVWTPLTPGASVHDAINSGTADGFCASIKAYERRYLFGDSPGGACW